MTKRLKDGVARARNGNQNSIINNPRRIIEKITGKKNVMQRRQGGQLGMENVQHNAWIQHMLQRQNLQGAKGGWTTLTATLAVAWAGVRLRACPMSSSSVSFG